mgnify:CR=1 FL=1
MNKRAIIILSAIFLLIVGTLGFLLFTRKGATPTNQGNNGNNNTPTPTPTPTLEATPTPTPTVTTGTGGPAKLLSEEVLSPVLFYKGDGISYFNSQGQLFQLDLRIVGNSASVSNKRQIQITPRPGISKVLWPSTGNSFIAQTDAGSKQSWAFYDGSRQVYVELPPQITALAWMPDATKIIYVWQGQNGKNSLNISNPDGSGYSKLADMYNSDTNISIAPDGKNILFYGNSNPTDKNPITVVTSDGKIFKSVVKDGYNLGALWAPDSKRFVFTKRDPQTQNFNLWMGNVLVDDAKNLGLNTTIDKVLWSQDGRFLYVSASNTSSGQSRESIYKVNTETLEKTEVVSGGSFSPREMFLSLNSEVLFFRNVNDNSLYSVPLGNLTTSNSSSVNILNSAP